MAEDRALFKSPDLTDLADCLSLTIKMQGFAHGVGQPSGCTKRRYVWAIGKGIGGEYLTGVVHEMRGDFAEKYLAKFPQLFLADAADAREILTGGRIVARHLTKGDVGENDVGRHGAIVGELFAQDAEFFKQRFVTGNFPGTMLLRRSGGRDRFGEGDLL